MRTPVVTTVLRPMHLKALRRAVREAQDLRGSMTGNPDPTPLAEFDAFIQTAKRALTLVKKMNDEARGVK
jgi:hypothetical protein